MSIKTKSGGTVVLATLAAVDAALAQANALIAQANAAKETIKADTEVKVKAEVESSMKRIAAILGRTEFNLGDYLPVVNAMKAGKSLFASNAATGDRTKLTDPEKDQVRAAMLERARAIKAGETPKPISAICAELGISTQTPKTYLPTKAQVDLLPGTVEVPATAYAAA